jgi:hypothetical protein
MRGDGFYDWEAGPNQPRLVPPHRQDGPVRHAPKRGNDVAHDGYAFQGRLADDVKFASEELSPFTPNPID